MKPSRRFSAWHRGCAFAWLSLLLAVPCSIARAVDAEPTSSTSQNSVSGLIRIVDRNGVEKNDHANVVVFLDGATAEPPPDADELPVISHKGRLFTPRVLPIVRGQKVDFYNDDVIFHNVFSLSKIKPFDLGIYPKGTSKIVQFDQPGLAKIYCNIHPNMISNILVLNNLLFDVTEADGRFNIENVPDGEYLLRVWHEFGEVWETTIRFPLSAPLEETIVVKETRRVQLHRNKFGKHYDTKYR